MKVDSPLSLPNVCLVSELSAAMAKACDKKKKKTRGGDLPGLTVSKGSFSTWILSPAVCKPVARQYARGEARQRKPFTSQQLGK